MRVESIVRVIESAEKIGMEERSGNSEDTAVAVDFVGIDCAWWRMLKFPQRQWRAQVKTAKPRVLCPFLMTSQTQSRKMPANEND